MGLSYLSNNQWLDSDCMLQQSLELELQQEHDHLVCFQDDFTLADTSIDPLFHHPPQPTTFISQQPQLPTTYYFDQLQDFHHQQQEQCYYSKRQKKTHYYSNPNPNLQDEAMLPCTTDPFFDGCYGVSSSADSQVVNQTDEAWLLPDVTFPPVFACGTNDNRCGRVGGGLSAQSIAARQRRRKIADKTQELGKLIPGGHKMNTADMFHSASMYVKFLQAQIAILTLTNPLQEGIRTGYHEEQRQHLKLLVESPMVQEKLYNHEKCLAPQKLVQSLSKDSKLQSEHPSVFQQINTLLTQARH